MIRLYLVCAVICSSFLLGCKNRDYSVDVGEHAKLRTPSGLFADVYADDTASSVVTISSPPTDSLQVAGYFEENEIYKLMIIREEQSIIMLFDGNASDPNNLSIGSIQSEGESRVIKRYALVESSEDD